MMRKDSPSRLEQTSSDERPETVRVRCRPNGELAIRRGCKIGAESTTLYCADHARGNLEISERTETSDLSDLPDER
ncbi:unnamed protein product [Arctogadus glacialis]